jgi:deoxyribonuclease-4
MSIAGGYYKAVEAASRAGCDCVQVFSKNNNQWAGKPISAEDVERFGGALAELRIAHPIAHNSYLINLAAPDDGLWHKSIDAFAIELDRADTLGIPYVVAHPGAHTTSTAEEGIERIAAALDEVHRLRPKVRAMCLLETTAGQGTCLGCDFQHLADILARVKHSDRLGICVDTCHVFAAGYPLSPKKEYMATMKALDAAVDLARVKAFHLNDSKREFGSRVDRHEHIGRGKIGIEAFELLMNDRRFKQTPMYLETPKGLEKGEELDVINLRTLRGLIKK